MKKETLILIAVSVLSLAIMGGGIMALSSSQSGQIRGVEQVISDDILLQDDAQDSNVENTKVTIVEFSDFQCPACAASIPVLKKYLEQYPDQINLVFRHFPLSYHSNAKAAASAAEAAGKQDKFWEMHDILFARQQEWQDLSKKEAEAKFVSYAEEMGVNLEQFGQDLLDPSLKQKIDRDISAGYQAKVNATPSFYINGRLVLGAGSPEFEQILQEELTK
jgi:protein-disulfide isomerase